MLKARKSQFFEEIFALYNRNLLRRRFHSLRVFGLESLAKETAQIPLIIYANHSSWWDGLVAFQISRKAGLDAYVMMEEKQLRKLFLFRLLGAFSVVREKPREAFRSVIYAANTLKEKPDRTLWIFPQGEILPNDKRPLNFYHGISKIIEKTRRCRLVPLAMRYEFLSRFKPEIFVKIGQTEIITVETDFDADSTTEHLSLNLTLLTNELKSDILNNHLQHFQDLI